MPRKGYKQTPEHVAKRTEQPVSDETKAKMSAAHLGQSWGQHSDEAKRKISEARSGKKLSEEHKAAISAGLKVGGRERTMPEKCIHPDGCDQPSRARGWCAMHWGRVKKNGVPGPAYTFRVSNEATPEGTQLCSGCREVKPLDEFYKFKKAKSGRHPRCKRCQRRTGQVKKYGIHSEGGACEVCGTTERLVIDHDHETNVVRGILCGDHNIAIGLFRDDPALLRTAAEYLERERILTL